MNKRHARKALLTAIQTRYQLLYGDAEVYAGIAAYTGLLAEVRATGDAELVLSRWYMDRPYLRWLRVL